ncbi:nucleoside-diphosphate kinase [Streptomyces erythrochromogenes]|uniref:nucleoside-diphosphate kinase n=1 Tax=Streptomyces erythrochromogenes TaxID=285574 RepID=UPI00369437E0
MLDPDRLALLVVKPDGVTQHLTRLISLWMRDEGHTLIAFRELSLIPERRARLYASSPEDGRIDGELEAVLYTLGPMHAMLFERKTGRAADGPSAAADVAGRLVGDPLPHRAGPGTLRGHFGALNPVLNLFHATSDTEHLDRETHALFGRAVEGFAWPNGGSAHEIGHTPHLPRPFKLWSTVAGVLAAWLGPEAVRAIDWPADSHGPSSPAVGAALMACTRAAQRAGGEAGALLTGVLDGSTSYARFCGLVPDIDPWSGYLTYTTLRHLPLCADTP